ncbi:nicotinamide riboside transporter PnuC [Leuconostoc palmae]|uniref:nicotinamide riboside transporter PnuC n=1 Tax=Leuconostoc palmae TaxID=501487 RepID=UPI001C7CF868|nr:nicotinamide riboside transporter PnuC [Leuconostoc palmae]
MRSYSITAKKYWQQFRENLIKLPKQVMKTFSIRENLDDLMTLNKASKIIMSLMLLATIIAFIFGKNFALIGWISLITGISTVMNLVLIDQGRMTNYSWGILSAAVWLIVAINNNLIGDIASQLFYFVMQFIGISVWHKNQLSDNTVKSRRISVQSGILYVAMTIVIYAIVLFVSHSLNGSQIYLDATLLPLGIVGQILMTYGYRSQWIAWIALNLINVIIWSRALQADASAGATSMLALQVIMLINSFYGQYMWFKQSAKTNN